MSLSVTGPSQSRLAVDREGCRLVLRPGLRGQPGRLVAKALG